MRTISRNFIGLTIALALTVVACGEDATGVTSGDELTSAEVAVVIAALGSAFDSVGVAAQQVAAAGPALAAININENFSLSVPCESGTLDVSGSMDGTVDDQTFAMDATLEVSWNPKGCVVSDDLNTFTVDGAPQVTVTLDISSSEDIVSLSGTETGGFSFTSSDGRSGSCAIDVTFSLVTTASSVESTITGTICGLQASSFETLGW
jgi:hypothetical protein